MPGARTSTIPPPGPRAIRPQPTACSRSPLWPPSAVAAAPAPRAAARITTTRLHPPPITLSGRRAGPGVRTRTLRSTRIPPPPAGASAEAPRRRRTPARASHLRKSSSPLPPAGSSAWSALPRRGAAALRRGLDLGIAVLTFYGRGLPDHAPRAGRQCRVRSCGRWAPCTTCNVSSAWCVNPFLLVCIPGGAVTVSAGLRCGRCVQVLPYRRPRRQATPSL